MRSPIRQRKVAVVIGAGFGGLAAAIRLSVKGYDVHIYEKLDAAGGRASVFRQDGHTFDAGPTIITAPFLLQELWALCGKRFEDDVKLVAMNPFYRIRFDDGSHFDYNGDPDHMRREVARFAPDDLPGYERFLTLCEKCKKLGFEGMGDQPFDSLGDLLRAIPDFLRMGAWRSIHAQVARHFKNEHLRTVMSFHPLLIGGNPFSVTAAYALINALERTWGVHSAMGGTGAIVQGMVKLLQARGVGLHFNAPVKKILVHDGQACGIELADGRLVDADIVVSNGDTAWTYKNLVDARYRRHWSDRRIERGRYSMGLLVWYFGTRKRYEEVPHHMLVLGPRYKGLLTDIFKRHVLAEDSSLAPPGCDTFYALAPVPHLDSGTDWRTQAEPMRQAIEQRLQETVLPGLSQHISTSMMMTPQDFQDRLWSFKGAGFGLEPLLLQSAWFRPHNRSEDLPGLYVVGASTHPGAGVPGVLMSAKALEKVVPDA
jgi:phytoene desaturase